MQSSSLSPEKNCLFSYLKSCRELFHISNFLNLKTNTNIFSISKNRKNRNHPWTTNGLASISLSTMKLVRTNDLTYFMIKCENFLSKTEQNELTSFVSQLYVWREKWTHKIAFDWMNLCAEFTKIALFHSIFGCLHQFYCNLSFYVGMLPWWARNRFPSLHTHSVVLIGNAIK